MVGFLYMLFDSCFGQPVNVPSVVRIDQSQCLYILEDIQKFFFMLVIKSSYNWRSIHPSGVSETFFLWFDDIELQDAW